MIEPIHIVFCADRRVLPGLHVAAYSVVSNHDDSESLVHVHVFSNDLTSVDLALLHETLGGTKRSYLLTVHAVSIDHFSGFPSMSGSWGAYFRLLAPRILAAERIIYMDVDTVCFLDVSDFMTLDLTDHPAGFVAESTIQTTLDRSLAERLRNYGDLPYFNSGVMVVNRKLWLERSVTERCMEFLKEGGALYHDQTALNFVLVNDWLSLDIKFNLISNWRTIWPSLCDESKIYGKLVHLLDNPKPWDLFGEFIHPHYRMWRTVLEKTAMRNFRSWHATSSRKLPNTTKAWNGYKKALKDRLLFSGYSRGWLRNVKGVPISPEHERS